MELYLFIILSKLVIHASGETNTHDVPRDLCDVSGGCPNTNKNILYATKIEFPISISTRSVELFGEEYMLNGLQEHLQQTFNLNPKDIFQYELKLTPADYNIPIQWVSFILQPYTPNVDILIFLIGSYTGVIETLGFPLLLGDLEENPLVTETVIWDSVKTVVSFALDVEYVWLAKFSIQASMNDIVTTLSQKSELDIRDMHDLELFQNDDGNTMVVFALPPVMSRRRSEVLENIKVFVENPCEKECKQSVSAISKEECKTCHYFDLFGVSIYPDPQSFSSRYETWTGNEIRFEAKEGNYKPCPDHMELCSSDRIGTKCVGIGRCDKYFYKQVRIILEVHGSIQLMDIYGLEYSTQVVKDSLVALHDLCESAMELEFRGKDPYLGRDKGIKSLEEMIMSKSDIEIDNLVITKVDGSYRKEYIDLNRGTPKYMENECFGCARDQIWCLLPNISLCMSKNLCIDRYYENLNLADDAEIVRFNLLLTSDEEFEVVDEIVRNDIKIQISEQFNCSVELLSEVDLVESEEKGYIELGFVVKSLYDKNKLQKAAINVHRVTDKGKLSIITPTAVYYAVPDTVMFRQYISGYPEPSQTEIFSPDLGNFITGLSFIVFVIFALLIAVACRKHRRSKSFPTMTVYFNPLGADEFILEQHEVSVQVQIWPYYKDVPSCFDGLPELVSFRPEAVKDTIQKNEKKNYRSRRQVQTFMFR